MDAWHDADDSECAAVWPRWSASGPGRKGSGRVPRQEYEAAKRWCGNGSEGARASMPHSLCPNNYAPMHCCMHHSAARRQRQSIESVNGTCAHVARGSHLKHYSLLSILLLQPHSLCASSPLPLPQTRSLSAALPACHSFIRSFARFDSATRPTHKEHAHSALHYTRLSGRFFGAFEFYSIPLSPWLRCDAMRCDAMRVRVRVRVRRHPSMTNVMVD
jgi:hypothetical protein